MSVSRDVWLIANPTAGGGRGGRAAVNVANALAAAGLAVRVVQPTSADGAVVETAGAVRAGAGIVVACGGDGTVNAVLQSLIGTDTALGIVACGSGDDVAASLGFPVHDDASAAAFIASAIAHDSIRTVDVGIVITTNGAERAFLGVLSTGFDSAVNERGNNLSQFRSQRYNVAMVRELASFVPASYRLRLDDEVICGDAMLVAVGNGPRYGRGLRICPDASVDDELLDVTWVSAVSRITLLRVFPSVFRGRHASHPAVRMFRGRRLEIEAAGQVAYADGERVGLLPVRVEVRPSALRVLAGPATG